MPSTYVFLDSVDYGIAIPSILSIFIEILSFINATIMLIIFATLSTIHLNMRLTSCNLWICMMLRSLLRITINVFYLFGYNVPYNVDNYIFSFTVLHAICNFGITFLELSIIAERIASALAERVYETYFSLPVVIALLILPWLTSILVVVAVFITRTFDMMITNYVSLVILIFTWAALFSILKYVKHANMRSKRNKSLSERYQHYENIKTKKTLYWVSVASAFVVLTTLICQAAKTLYFTFDGQRAAYMMAFFNIILNIGFGASIASIPFAFIFAHKEVHKKYVYGLFGCHNRSPSCSVAPMSSDVPPNSQILSIISGRPLVFHNQGKHYFSALDKDWETAFDTKYTMDFPHKYSNLRRPSTQSERFLSI